MKKLIYPFLLVLAACGGGSGGIAGSAPQISNLVLSNESAFFMEGGGTVLIQAQINYFDPQADIVTVIIEVSDGSSISISVPQPLPGPSGILLGELIVPTDTSGVFTAEVWAVDAGGRGSNRLTTTFTVFGSSELTDLVISAAPLDQAFQPAVIDYTATVETDVASITLTATTLDSNALLTVNGVAGVSGTPFGPINLNFGANVIVVNVAADVGNEVRDYTLAVTRKLSTNTRLSSLIITPGTLDQPFDPMLLNYSTTLSLLSSTVTATAVTEDVNATIWVSGVNVPSGSPSPAVPVSLELRNSTITVTVFAQDGVTTVNYDIEATRQLPPYFATFTKIADQATTMPGQAVNFGIFSEPAYDGTNVAFQGGGSGKGGVYTNEGGTLRKVADSDTPEPVGGIQPFAVFGNPDIDGGNVVFSAFAAGFAGIYSEVGGALNVIADNLTPVPGGSGTLSHFSDPNFNAGNTIFSAGGFGFFEEGVYTNAGGTLQVVADMTTPVPNAGLNTFEKFDAPRLDGGDFLYWGQSMNGVPEGIYRDAGSGPQVVADSNTLVPGGVDNLRFFDRQPVQSGTNVAFGARDSANNRRIYRSAGVTIKTAIDTDTPMPLGSRPFETRGTPIAMNAANLIVQGFGAVLVRDGAIAKLIGTNDQLDGQEIGIVTFRHEGLSGDQIALLVRYEDFSRAIYVADFSIVVPNAVAAYELNNSLADEKNGPNLVALGGQLQPTGYAFNANQGLTLSGVLDPNGYSIEFVFNLADVTSSAKILDFAELASDSGLYIDNGLLTFLDQSVPRTISSAGKRAIENDVNIHAVITRDDATGEVVGYVDGEEYIRFTDTSAAAVFATSIANFFIDDDVTMSDASAGFVHSVRAYDGALTMEQVRFLARSLSDCDLDGCP